MGLSRSGGPPEAIVVDRVFYIHDGDVLIAYGAWYVRVMLVKVC